MASKEKDARNNPHTDEFINKWHFESLSHETHFIIKSLRKRQANRNLIIHFFLGT